MARTKEAKKRAAMILDRLINDTSKNLGIPVENVREVLNFTYGFILEKIKEGKGEGIRLKGLGVFAIKGTRRKRFEEERLKKLESKPNGDTTEDKR